MSPSYGAHLGPGGSGASSLPPGILPCTPCASSECPGAPCRGTKATWLLLPGRGEVTRHRASSQGCPLACGVTVPVPAAPSPPKGHEAPAWHWRELECGNIQGWSREQSLGQEIGTDLLGGPRTCWGRNKSGGGVRHHCSGGGLHGMGAEMQLVFPGVPAGVPSIPGCPHHLTGVPSI